MNTNINAVLVRLHISIFPNQRQDRQITDEVKLKKALGVPASRKKKPEYSSFTATSNQQRIGV